MFCERSLVTQKLWSHSKTWWNSELESLGGNRVIDDFPIPARLTEVHLRHPLTQSVVDESTDGGLDFESCLSAGMGYVEAQFSLPRWLDVAVSRQTMFDKTFDKTPTSGWMFLPIESYSGGGAEAIFEPLEQNLLVRKRTNLCEDGFAVLFVI